MKKKAAEIIIRMADKHGSVLFEEPLFIELYEQANKYISKLLDAKIKRRKAKGQFISMSEQEIDKLIRKILNAE